LRDWNLVAGRADKIFSWHITTILSW